MVQNNEGLRRGESFSGEDISSGWNSLAQRPERQDAPRSRESTKVIAEAAIEASRKIADVDHLDSNSNRDDYETDRVVISEEMKARHEAEMRHDRALMAVDALLFDGAPIPESMRELIEQEGGIDSLSEQALRENAQSFGKFELINAYDSAHGSFSGFDRRQMEAVRYLARQAGRSERGFMAAERSRRNVQRTQAVELVRQTILNTQEGRRNIPYDAILSFDDFDVMAPFDPHELERRAREQMYLANSKMVLQSLISLGNNSRLDLQLLPREAREGRRFMINKYGNGDESRAETRLEQMARDTFQPNLEQRRRDEQVVRADAERIREADIREAVAEYHRTGNVRQLWSEAERLVRESIPLSEKIRDVRVVFDETTGLKPDERGREKAYATGQYRSASKEVVIFLKKYREKSRERGERANDADYLEDIIDTIAHELYHSYQREKTKNDSTERSVKLAINWCDYKRSDDTDEHGDPLPMADAMYRRQLLEREAFTYGSAVLERFRQYLH